MLDVLRADYITTARAKGLAEQVVIVKLPYGAIDRFAQAQCAALGAAQQRRKIYLPQATAMFRQGFGRLQRHRDDRGAVGYLRCPCPVPQASLVGAPRLLGREPRPAPVRILTTSHAISL